MDSRAVVGQERAGQGRAFLSRLQEEGFAVEGAMWAQVEGDSQPYLYIVSPNVESDGPIGAYLRMGSVLRQFQPEPADPAVRIDPFALRLLRPSDPVARALACEYERYPGPSPTHHHGSILGRNLPIDGAYIYPATLFAAPAAPPT